MNTVTNFLRTDVEDLPEVFRFLAVVIVFFGLVCQTVTGSETKTGGAIMVSLFVGVGYLFVSTLVRMAGLAA